ncbi:unnamed protein product [Paramecium octaurelia]|uniref:Transmembrane protein n=1 Tax=Paramecium octaurelia TaxID=43137 RepID=A0A8S1W5Q6_PAROT|nr:unnamed protein product [Paramecium octaurelia]
MITIVLQFIQIGLFAFGKFLSSNNNTNTFFALAAAFAIEIIVAAPTTDKTKWICSKSMQSICKNALLFSIILQHIEDEYLYWVVLSGGILKITKNFTTVLAIKKIDQILKYNTFVGIYAQIFSFYKIVQVCSYLFLTSLFLQLELHTIILGDYWKINSLVVVNFCFIPFAFLIIFNLFESIVYIKWSLKGEQQKVQQKEQKKEKKK